MLLEAVALAGPGGFASGAALSYLAPDLIRRRSVALRRVATAIAAIGGAAAGCHPTGVAIFDPMLAAGVAGAFTYLGARAKPRTLTAAAVAGALGTVGSTAGLLGFATAGAALAMALTARRAPVAAVVIAAAVANIAVRLQVPGPNGIESLAAVAILVAPAWSGHKRLSKPMKRRLRRGLFVATGVASAFAFAGVLALTLARPPLERGTDHAVRGLAAAGAADVATARTELAAASDAFGITTAHLGAWWVRPALLVPIVAQHIRALRTAAATGHNLAVAADQVAKASNLGSAPIRDGQIALAPISRLGPPLAHARTGVDQAVGELRAVRSSWLLPPVNRRLDATLVTLAKSRASLTTSADLVQVLPGLLGANGSRRWFLAVQTPAEARATGGMIGNFGEILADRGRLTLPRFGRTSELNAGGNPATRTLTGPPDYLARYERFAVARTWNNITMSPDFPSVAKVIGGLYPQSGGQAVDGVIAIDPAGVAALLRLTGPIKVPDWPEPLTSANAERILLYDEYVSLQNNTQRVDFLGTTTRALWGRLTSGELPPPKEILQALGPVIARKHLQISSLDPAEDVALQHAGVNGRMAPVRNDALAVVTQNASGNKIDWFLHRDVGYHVTVDPTTQHLTATVAVTLHNDAPAAGLPDYVIGSATKPPLPRGTNRLYLSVYTPWSLSAARIAGAPVGVESEHELGRHVYSTYVDIAPQGEVTVQLELTGQVQKGEPYALDLRAQPLVTPDRVTVSYSRARARTTTRTFVLEADRRLAFAGDRP